MPLLMLCYLVALIAIVRRRTSFREVREAALISSLVLGLTVAAATEVLSALVALRPATVLAFWLLVTSAAVIAAYHHSPWPILKLGGLPRVPPPATLAGALLLVCGAVALKAPPNAFDGHLYHLPRVMHWAQNETVSFYPSNLVRQLHVQPLTEYFMLHLVLLEGADTFVNLVQWLALLGSAIAASLIARELGATSRGQALAALGCVSLPIAVVQASGPKNDILVGYWCLVLAWLLVRARLRFGLELALWGGLTVALALLTKSTASIAMAPLLATAGLASLIRQPRAIPTVLGTVLVMAVIVITLNAPHALQNVRHFGSPLGPKQDGPSPEFAYLVSHLTPQTWASNAVRNLAVNLGTPWEPVNQWIVDTVRSWHEWAGLDVRDPRTTFGNGEFTVAGDRLQDEYTGNPIHTMLIGLLVLSLALGNPARLATGQRWYPASLILAFCLFSALVTWQVSNTRFLMPLFFLWCPLLGLVGERLPRAPAATLILVLTLSGAHSILEHRSRPPFGEDGVFTIDRESLYYTRRPGLMQQYRDAARHVVDNGCQSVGLHIDWNDLEYPWWRLLESAAWPRGRIEHVGIENPSRALAYPRPEPFVPCAIVSTSPAPAEVYAFGGVSFLPVHASSEVSVYLPPGAGSPVVVPFAARYQADPPQVWQMLERATYAVRVQNAGSETWGPDGDVQLRAQFRLPGATFDIGAETRLVALRSAVAPGQLAEFQVELSAPRVSGGLVIDHVMVKRGIGDFPAVHSAPVSIQPPEPTPTERRRDRPAR